MFTNIVSYMFTFEEKLQIHKSTYVEFCITGLQLGGYYYT